MGAGKKLTGGHRGWVAIVVDTAPAWDMVASLVGTASALIAPKPKRARA